MHQVIVLHIPKAMKYANGSTFRFQWIFYKLTNTFIILWGDNIGYSSNI
jgi:hypothetical protein